MANKTSHWLGLMILAGALLAPGIVSAQAVPSAKQDSGKAVEQNVAVPDQPQAMVAGNPIGGVIVGPAHPTKPTKPTKRTAAPPAPTSAGKGHSEKGIK